MHLGYLGYKTIRTNLLGWFLLLAALAYGLSGPFLLKQNLNVQGVVHKETQDRSFWVILPGFLLVFYGSPLDWLYLSQLFHRPGSLWIQFLGLALITVSIILLNWARLTLRDLYSGRVQVVAGHSLVRNGPYQIIRHPAYASYILLCLGIGIGYSSLVGVLSVPLLLIPGLVYRIKIEEKILTTEFGDQYSIYANDTRRLIPYIW